MKKVVRLVKWYEIANWLLDKAVSFPKNQRNIENPHHARRGQVAEQSDLLRIQIRMLVVRLSISSRTTA